MNRNTQLSRVERATHPLAGLQAAEPGPEHVDPYQKARRALRGRYRLVALLAILGFLAGGVVGWKVGKPVYKSQGLIRIAYSERKVLDRDSEPYIPIEVYQAFLQSQKEMLQSRPVLDLALEDQAWRATGRGSSPRVIATFADNLWVEHKGGTDYLRVNYIDADPAAAAAAVRAIIRSYEKLYDSQDDQVQRQTLGVYERQKESLNKQLSDLAQKTQANQKEGIFVTADLYEASVQRVAKLEGLLTEIEMALALAPEERTALVPLTEQQIRLIDAEMARMCVEREAIESQLAALKRQGWGEKSKYVTTAQGALDDIHIKIARYAAEYNRAREAMSQQPPTNPQGSQPGQGPSLAGRSKAVLEKDKEKIVKQIEEAKGRMMELGRARQQVEFARGETERLTKELAETTNRIQQMQAQSGIRGRLNIVDYGNAPIAPFKDRRRQFAAAAGVSGAMLPVALMIFAGLVSTRYRFSDETEADLARQTPLLGILPMLPDRMSDPDQAADAAQCVHQIRVMLQVGKPAGSKSVYLVTSAASGEGKTSLTAGLALSFAASGSKTLIIDADLVGRRLTDGFKADKWTGLHEALREGSIRGHVRGTATKGLFILPCGQADALESSTLPAGPVEQLIEEVRKQFDVVLIDSGPVLGSIEASVVGPHTDGAILVIARHQQKPLVERAVRQLNSMGVRLCGMVFNRAERKDFHRSVSYSSLRSASASPLAPRASAPEAAGVCAFGPLVRSVASLLPASGEDTGTDQKEAH